MSTLRQALQRLLALFRSNHLTTESDREMASHIALATDENLRSGMSPAEARRQALIRFGGIQQAREQHHTARSIPALEILSQDLRYAARTLRRDLSFAAIAILILAIACINYVNLSTARAMLRCKEVGMR